MTAETAVQTIRLYNFPQPKHARILSPNGRAHWAEKHRTRLEMSRVIASAAILYVPKPWPLTPPVALTVRYVVPIRRQRDDDNYATGVTKVVRDVLVRIGLLEGDDTDRLRQTIEIVYEPNQRLLELTLTPLLTGPADPWGRER